MENVIFEPRWKIFFETQGLRRFDDFFDYRQGETINRNTKRNVTVLHLPDGGQTKTFYMKRFFDPHFKDMLFTLRNFGTICSQAELEYRNASILLEHGIETYRPVCYGVRSVCGIERQSFFITEEIDGECLQDYLRRRWAALAAEDRQALVVKLARFFATIHAAGLSLPDSYIWHVYMVNTPDAADNYEFGMIDLHRMKRCAGGDRPAAMNLGRFFYSLPDGFMDAALDTLFWQHYRRDRGDGPRFARRVARWQAKFQKRRKRVVCDLVP